MDAVLIAVFLALAASCVWDGLCIFARREVWPPAAVVQVADEIPF